MRRYTRTFQFFDTEEQAKSFCDRMNALATPYARKKHPAHYMLWESQNRQEHKFVVWYSY